MDSFLQRLEKQSKTKKPVVMAFGRMNPPTTGHEKLVNKVHQLAKDYGADHRVDRKSTRLNSSHIPLSRMPSSA